MKDLILVLVSGGLFSFIQFFITFGFSRKDKTKELEKQLAEIKEDQRMFMNKSHVTYSCFNFLLQRCFLDIYKKHVSPKRRVIGKDFL